MRLKVTASTASDTKDETEQTRKEIDEDRKIYIQATIVRILKSRKRVTHNELMTEVIDQNKSRFQPDVVQIKKEIEHLIERGYMDRDDGANDVYIYIA